MIVCVSVESGARGGVGVGKFKDEYTVWVTNNSRFSKHATVQR